MGPIQALWGARARSHPGLVCMHVRQGDKKKEMRLVPLSEYMKLADTTIRRWFPHASKMWLTTEMRVRKKRVLYALLCLLRWRHNRASFSLALMLSLSVCLFVLALCG